MDEGGEVERLHAVIAGRVQGVGFRFFVLQAAQEAGVSGWVRNLWDGSVELVAEGRPDALDALAGYLRRGPRGAFVTNMDQQRLPATGEFSGFEIRQSV